VDLDTILGILFFIVFVVLPLFSGAGRRGQGRGRTGPGQGRGQATGAPGQAGASRDEPSVTLAEIRRRVEEAQRREDERGRALGAGRPQASTTQPRGLVTSDPFEGSLVSGSERRLSDLGRGSSGSLGPEGAGRGADGAAAAERARPAAERYVIGPEGAMPEPFPTGGYVIGREGAAPAQPRPTGGTLGREGLAGREGVGTTRSRSDLLGREGAAARAQPTVTPSVSPSRRERLRAKAEAEIGGRERRDDGRPAAGGAKARISRAGLLRTDRDSVLAGLVWHEVLSPPRALRHWRGR